MKKLLLIIIVSLLAAIDKAVACQYTSVNAIAEDAKDSLWPTINNFLPYIILAIILVSAILYILFLRKQREIYKEKIRFFANTAHDMRTPLTLIKAPLDEITERDTISDVERNNLNLALKNVDILLQLTTTLINFEKTDCYSGNLSVTEYELNAYMNDMVQAFQPYTEQKHITLNYDKNFTYQNVWMDKDRMDTILKNLLSNALKHTPEGGNIHILATVQNNNWSIEIKEVGIGLLLVKRLVRLHKGKLSFQHENGKGICAKISFPLEQKHYRKAIYHASTHKKNYTASSSCSSVSTDMSPSSSTTDIAPGTDKPFKLLIVENNDDLRNYLCNTLSNKYKIQSCTNGKQGLLMAKEYMPDLIISDMVMPEMQGDELCQAVKDNIETSHIPIILLSSLNTDKDIIEGLQTKADKYISKPFNIGLLRADIESLLANRMLLRRKYADPSWRAEENDGNCINCSSDIDWQFMASVRKHVEDNINNQAFNVDSLCALMNMSRTSFYNKIKALTEQAPADYIRLIRLKRAGQLLKEQKYTVTEIAEMTGFNDAKYFREVFKKHFKVSPTQYGKQSEA